MSAAARPDPVSWSGSTDSEGHRTYKVAFLVDCEAEDGPASVMEATGLPETGSQWQFGDDSDLWAWCLADMTVEPVTQGEACKLWRVSRSFSTKPTAPNRCVDQKIESPLLTPPEVSGDFVRYNEEASYDRFGFPITNSAWEQIRGPTVEFDHNRQTVKIKMNVALLQLDVVGPMIDTVNAYPLWGLPSRCIKLSKAPWSRKFYGSCYVYYEYNFEFDISVTIKGTSGFDKDILDEGTKVLFGHWGQGPGAGCTVSVTVSGDIITAVTLSAGGSGYQQNTVILLSVSGGSGGSVYANVDASGVVAGIALFKGGTGYTAGIKATTVANGAWVLDNIGGLLPDPSNPSHFIHFKDRHGENTRVVLNGAGLPSEAVLTLPPSPIRAYVSLKYANVGNALTSTEFWAAFRSTGGDWDQDVTYVPGDVVWRPGTNAGETDIYIAQDTVAPNLDQPPEYHLNVFWVLLNDGVENVGTYSASTRYNAGQIVTPSASNISTTGQAGNRHVEKYDESDFTLLGIPLEF